MISKTVKILEDRNEMIDLSIIKKSWEILLVLLIIFTILYFTCFGCFLVLNDATSWTAQTVTLSNEEEGGGSMRFPDSMGEYQLAEDNRNFNWYRHVDREDRFLMYNNLGINIKYVNYALISGK